MQTQTAERLADGGAVVAVTTAAVSWIAEAQAVVQLVTTVIAGVSGIVALCYHVWRWRHEAKHKRRR